MPRSKPFKHISRPTNTWRTSTVSHMEHDLRIQLGLRDKEISVLQRRLADCEATLQAMQESGHRRQRGKTRDELKHEVQTLIDQIKIIDTIGARRPRSFSVMR